MSKILERRQRIIEELSFRRFATYRELADEFGVSKDTIRNDIAEISLSVPLITISGNGGGIRVADGWYASRTYLCDEDEELLRRLLPGLQPEDQKRMQHILSVFAKPQVKEKKH